MQIYGEDEDGNFIILYDSRWRHPELLGYEKETPEYKGLQQLWKERNGKSGSGKNKDQVHRPRGDDFL